MLGQHRIDPGGRGAAIGQLFDDPREQAEPALHAAKALGLQDAQECRRHDIRLWSSAAAAALHSRPAPVRREEGSDCRARSRAARSSSGRAGHRRKERPGGRRIRLITRIIEASAPPLYADILTVATPYYPRAGPAGTTGCATNQNMPDLRIDSDDNRTPLGVLREVFGFDSFRGQQLAIIEQVLAGGDAVVLMPTGGGKSLCYQVPALLRPGVGVVVSPLIALMKDQVDALRQAGVRAAALNSRLSPGEAADDRTSCPGWRSRSALCVARTAAHAALPGAVVGCSACPLRCRRGALHLAMGARFPP